MAVTSYTQTLDDTNGAVCASESLFDVASQVAAPRSPSSKLLLLFLYEPLFARESVMLATPTPELSHEQLLTINLECCTAPEVLRAGTALAARARGRSAIA